MRADAKLNYAHILAVANTVVMRDGADASLRDIARQADVGLGTLYRHFPTREDLLDALLRASFDALADHARVLEQADAIAPALVSWLRDVVACARNYKGVIAAMMAAMNDEASALHASCVTMRAAGTRLLERAQAEGLARPDMNGEDLFSLAAALAWLGDQPASAPRVEHLFTIISGAIFTQPVPPPGA